MMVTMMGFHIDPSVVAATALRHLKVPTANPSGVTMRDQRWAHPNPWDIGPSPKHREALRGWYQRCRRSSSSCFRHGFRRRMGHGAECIWVWDIRKCIYIQRGVAGPHNSGLYRSTPSDFTDQKSFQPLNDQCQSTIARDVQSALKWFNQPINH